MIQLEDISEAFAANNAMGLCERYGFLVDVLRGVDPFQATGKDSEA